MKYDSRKTFPYPVLRDCSTDYTSGEFSTNQVVSRKTKSTEIELHVAFTLTNSELNAHYWIGQVAPHNEKGYFSRQMI